MLSHLFGAYGGVIVGHYVSTSLSPFIVSAYLHSISLCLRSYLPSISFYRPPCCSLCPPCLLLFLFVSGLVPLVVGHCGRLVFVFFPFISLLVRPCVRVVFLLVSLCLRSCLPSCWSLCPSCFPSVSFLLPWALCPSCLPSVSFCLPSFLYTCLLFPPLACICVAALGCCVAILNFTVTLISQL